MQRDDLVSQMLKLLNETLVEHSLGETTEAATAATPLIGPQAVLTSMGVVSLVTDIELMLAERYQVEVTLVSEQALSRRRSPFRNLDALADYTLELVGAPTPPALTTKS